MCRWRLCHCLNAELVSRSHPNDPSQRYLKFRPRITRIYADQNGLCGSSLSAVKNLRDIFTRFRISDYRLPPTTRRLQSIADVVASRQSAAFFARNREDGGALPSRRYGLALDPAEAFGRQAEGALEGAGKIARIAEAQFVGHFLDQPPRVLQQFRGPIHAQMLEITKGALAAESLEEPAEVGHVDVEASR